MKELGRNHRVVFVIALLIPLVCIAAPKTGALGVSVSGGENHTLVITDDGRVHACGNNYGQDVPGGGHLYFGVLGTGSQGADYELMLVRVLAGEMSTASGWLENVEVVAAGWKHSLALDENRNVWAWGDNEYGELGNGESGDPLEEPAPVKVHGPGGVGFLDNITAIAAGRSGEHSLAVRSDNTVWAWGINRYGQLGNNKSGSKPSGGWEFEPAPV